MTYGNLAQVQNYISAIVISGATKPSDVQITSLLTDFSAEVDFILLSRGYEVPVLEPVTAVTYLNALVAKGVAGNVLCQAMPQFPEGGGWTTHPLATEYCDQYQAALVELASAMVAVGLERKEEQSSPFGYANAAWGNPNAKDVWGNTINAEPAFSRNKPL